MGVRFALLELAIATPHYRRKWEIRSRCGDAASRTSIAYGCTRGLLPANTLVCITTKFVLDVA